MTSSVVRIENLNKILNTLSKIGVDSQNLKGATTKASALVLPPSKANAPVRKGKLQRTVKASTARNKVQITAGTPNSVPYGAAIHWGWKKRNIQPNSWLLEVRDRYGDEVKDIYITEIQKLIDQNLDKVK